MPSLHQYDGTGSCAFSIASLYQEGTQIEAVELLSALQAVSQLDANSIQKLYCQWCATPASSSIGPQPSIQQVNSLYSKGLAAAADIQQKSVKADTLKVRQSAMIELADCLHSTHAASSKTVMTVIHEDILHT